MVRDLRYCCAILMFVCASCSAGTELVDDDYSQSAGSYGWSDDELAPYDSVRNQFKRTEVWGKKAVVFGGSISSLTESRTAKYLWSYCMGWTIQTLGMGGAGFSSLQNRSIISQVERAPKADIYILWCSTNDVTSSSPLIDAGEAYDYSLSDGFNEKSLVTQCGGLNYCIRTLQQKYPLSKILLFTSLPYFSAVKGFEADTTNHKSLAFFVERQKECAQQASLPCFDQFSLSLFTPSNYVDYYKDDKTHLKKEGYKVIAKEQMRFFYNLFVRE